jgi:mannose-1-phosphate guanylyltransferase
MSKIKQTSPLLFKQLEEIKKDIGTKKENQTLQKIYRQIKSIHFDHIVLEHIKQNEALVIEGDLDWSDPGTLYALKQFLEEKHADNVNKGLVYNFDTQDSLVYNYVNKQLVATIGLEGFIVINTPDAILVCHKDDVRRISDMVKEFKGTELEELL